MDNLQKKFVVTGIGLIALGFVYGFGYTLIVDHAALLVLKDNFGSVFVQVAQEIESGAVTTGAVGNLDHLLDSSVRYRRAIGAHTHAINLGLLIILFGFLFALVEGKKGRFSAVLFAFGAFFYPFGLALQAMGWVLAGEFFSVLGSGSVIFGVGILLQSLFLDKTNNLE